MIIDIEEKKIYFETLLCQSQFSKEGNKELKGRK